MKRPWGWHIDDMIGTRPLFDLLLSGPGRSTWRDWAAGIAETIRRHSTRLARAYRRSHRAYRRSAIYRDDQELGMLSDERLRRQTLPDRVADAARLDELYARIDMR